jgi:hypothetical protein
MEGSKFREIITDHVDDNGAVHMDGYKTADPNEEGVVIAVVINGEPYFRDSEDQFDPLVQEELKAIKRQQAEEKEELKKEIRKAVSGVVYTLDAKPRLTFTDGSPLENKLSLIDEGVRKIMDLL